jgi:integration host factor subunit beta
MNKRDIIEKIALDQELSNSATAKCIDDVLSTLVDSIIEGNGSEIRGFGTFTKKNRKPRTGINPKTSERTQVPGKSVPFFKTSKLLNNLVNSN